MPSVSVIVPTLARLVASVTPGSASAVGVGNSAAEFGGAAGGAEQKQGAGEKERFHDNNLALNVNVWQGSVLVNIGSRSERLWGCSRTSPFPYAGITRIRSRGYDLRRSFYATPNGTVFFGYVTKYAGGPG